MPRPTGHGPGYEARRREIIRIAAELFSRNGYAATGVAELCQATDLAKGALYHYIGSKQALLAEIHGAVMTPLLAAAERISKLPIAPELRLRLLSQMLLEVIEHRLDYIRVVEHEIDRLAGENRKRMLHERRRFEDMVTELHAEAIRDGTFRELDPRLCMLQFFNMHNYTFQWLRPGRWSSAQLAEQYCTTLFRGHAVDSNRFASLEEQLGTFRASYTGESLSGLGDFEEVATAS
ncbi:MULTISPECIES: TetR/AcrR family transcriptional regulator [Amycolatopsis]|uniref:TetR/AcrR family transcriptional regulator n=1 Tax=Amycolatopsis TaxID=1813 RepID=UPI000B8B3102|nr:MULTISPECIES: TetR/AcrR family transcriptional regulator [Amycolatopsis]OXM67136.1 TetR family transcriptional regulator [Amycolatopsis sp. KNN50.9b]